jgi:hypothetical protein
MTHQFYLSSYDFGQDSRPRKCVVLSDITGTRANSQYLLVNVTPPLSTSFWDGPIRDFDRLILSIIGKRTINDVGICPVSVEIVLCPSYSGGVLDERKCSKIGAGGLHATYAEASEKSPLEER